MKLLVKDFSQDLHIHTGFSDGVEEVDSIIMNAHVLGIKNISITDHNTMAAYENLSSAFLKQYDINLIPGVEISCFYKDKKIHVLGYNINPKMFTLLKKVFYKEDKETGKEYMSFKKAAWFVHLLGGKLFLAHPYKYKHDFKGKALLDEILKEGVLDGIECFHAYNTKEETQTLLAYAKEYDLYVSGGSDYHYKGKRVRKDIKSKGIGRLDVMGESIENAINNFSNNQLR